MAVVGSVLHEEYPLGLYLIHVGDALQATLLMALILGAWRRDAGRMSRLALQPRHPHERRPPDAEAQGGSWTDRTLSWRRWSAAAPSSSVPVGTMGACGSRTTGATKSWRSPRMGPSPRSPARPRAWAGCPTD